MTTLHFQDFLTVYYGGVYYGPQLCKGCLKDSGLSLCNMMKELLEGTGRGPLYFSVC